MERIPGHIDPDSGAPSGRPGREHAHGPGGPAAYGIAPEALACIDILESDGGTAWVVGGYVRDLMLGRPSSDVDIAASSSAERSAALLHDAGWKVIPTGIRHGTITAISGSARVEVTAFRREGAYSDGRHPDAVEPADSIDEDLSRRDFTVNAMALHPRRGLKDPFGGLRDLKTGVIRTVGDPHARFAEDGLRILRCLRFASQLSFSIDGQTAHAAHECSSMLGRISAERLESELRKLICGEDAARVIREHYGVIAAFLPEIAPMAGLDQKSPYHCFDVLEHTVRTMELLPADPELRYAALFHDMGKPRTMTVDENGRGHFYGHPEESEKMAGEIARRLRLPKREAARICSLVRLHDETLHATEKSIRRMMARLDGDEGLFRKLIALKKADALTHAPGHTERAAEMDGTAQLLDAMSARSRVFKRSDMAINGKDLMELGVQQGPELGKLLAVLFDDIVEARIGNDRGALMERATQLLSLDPQITGGDAAVLGSKAPHGGAR